MESRFKRTACAANTSEQQARARRTNVAAPIGRAQGDAKSLRSEVDAACEKHQVQGRYNHGDEGPGGQLACPAKELDLHHQTIERSNSEQRKGRGAAPVQPFYLYLAYGSRLERADERTRTADLISLRVIGQVSQGCARVCKFGIYKPICLPRIALCCTVLRSRWYQSGIRTSDRYSLTSSRMARTRALRSHNPPIPVSRRCRMLQNRLI